MGVSSAGRCGTAVHLGRPRTTPQPDSPDLPLTAVITGLDSSKTTARNSDLEVGNVVEESFLDVGVRDELINDLHNLSEENPLSETTSVELDTDASSAEAPTEQPVSCSLVPELLQSIPFLGAVLNTVMCFLFGPEGILANLAGLFV